MDSAVRTVAEGAGRATGKQFIVRNVGGATGTIGSRQAKNAKADGCTLLAGSINTLVLAPRALPHAGYSFSDFTPVGLLGHTEYILLANRQVDADDIPALASAAAKRQDPLSFGHPGVETVQYLALTRLAREMSISVLPVPYKGSAPMMNDLGGGHIDLAVVARPAAAAAVALGTAKKLGDITAWLNRDAGSLRLPAGWAGWVVSRRTPARELRWLRAAFAKALNDPETRRRLASIDSPAATSAEQRAFLQNYQDEMRRLANLAN